MIVILKKVEHLEIQKTEQIQAIQAKLIQDDGERRRTRNPPPVREVVG